MIFDSKRDVSDNMSKLDRNCTMCINLNNNWLDRLWLFRFYSKYKIKYAMMALGIIPQENIDKNVRNKSLLRELSLFKISYSNIKTALRNRLGLLIPFFYFGVSPAVLLLASGKLSEDYYYYPRDRNTEVLWLHALDYDLYLEENNKPFLPDMSGNAVFLDDNVPYHPEEVLFGNDDYPVTAEMYFTNINKFLDYIEKEQNLKVVIAAHPTSDYSDKPGSFGNRKIIYGNTIGCVRSAKFVISHSSTALNYAVLYRKPVIFIYTNEMTKQRGTVFDDNFSSWFGKRPINIDLPYSIDWKQELTVDENKYKLYQNAFIKKSNTKEEHIWQTVANRLSTMQEDKS
ncbi:MAG: hypothetical protein OIN86_14245 [Candidatus Methanoperedens sp.]|nr:hypothetical protein [Candidatus Methanoperedens sp.]